MAHLTIPARTLEIDDVQIRIHFADKHSDKPGEPYANVHVSAGGERPALPTVDVGAVLGEDLPAFKKMLDAIQATALGTASAPAKPAKPAKPTKATPEKE